MTGQHLLVQNISHGKEKPFGSGLARSLWVSLALQVQKHKAAILEVLQRGLENTTCPVVAAESMLALAEVVRKLKAEGLGSAFKDIARSTKMFFEAEPDVLRFSAFSLYAALAAAASASGKRSFFTREVGETWVSLLLHLRDPIPEVSNVCRTTLYLCAPFLVPERVQETVVTSIGLSAAQLQYEVGHCLVSELCPGGETSQPQGCSPEPRREREATRQGWAGWEPGGMGAGQLVLRHGLPSWLPARSFSFPSWPSQLDRPWVSGATFLASEEIVPLCFPQGQRCPCYVGEAPRHRQEPPPGERPSAALGRQRSPR
ncbi:uncharacterized protein [Haliaeetus albicilla]|uniref:uncharacterized protein isoform X1 n=1 Tax=Haliaeetus albicilla TaxID=8969 RepID=UPI0037E9B384